MIIAIDGTAGSGKSSIARLLSEKLDFLYLNTGSLYRMLTAYFLDNSIRPNEINKKIIDRINITYLANENKLLFFVNNISFDKKLRDAQVSLNVAEYSKIELVREKVRSTQYQFKNQNLVIEGRDITTVVYPNADFKFYIDASLEVRAKRRHMQKENDLSYQEIYDALKLRDEMDKTRNSSPLLVSDNSYVYDNSTGTLEENVNKLLKIILER